MYLISIHRDLPCQYTCLLSKNFSDSKQKNKTLSFHVKKKDFKM